MASNYPLVEVLESFQSSPQIQKQPPIPDDGFFASQNLLRLVHGAVPPDQENVHRIIKRRYKHGVHHLSRCRDLFPPDKTVAQFFRVDSMDYQSRVPYDVPASPRRAGRVITKFLRKIKKRTLCKDIKKRFEVYGHVGRGTSAYILAARAKNDKSKQYVLKIQYADIRKMWKPARQPAFTDYIELGTKEMRYIPTEAVYLQLTAGCPRFPKLDSVYMHNDMTVIAMSAEAVVQRPERETLVTEDPLLHQFRSYSGEQLIEKKTPRLSEVQVCKIATQLLQAMMYLEEMNMVHEDMSHRNYLVDEYLNTTLIDLGLVYTAVDKNGWINNRWYALVATEFLNSPEVALRLLAGTDPTPTTSCKTIDVEYVHDMRGEQLWKFGALIYDLLHGYAPWEVPTLDPKVGALRDIHDLEATDDIRSYIRSRRHRMFIDDLAIDNRLSQDCTDVLRILLARKLEDRPKLEQIAAFPWFQGHWVDYPLETFRRPPFKRAPPPKHGEIRYFEQRS